MSKINYDEVVAKRVGTQAHFLGFRRKQHTLRRLVAGDLSPVGMGSMQKADADPNAASAIDGDWMNYLTDEHYEINVVDVRQGRSNQMWQGIKTLALQTSFKQPRVDFEDLSSEESSLNSAYLKAILGPSPRGCNAVDVHRKALIDYLIGGIGATSLIFRNGRPAETYTDILDLTWDTSADILPNIGWVSRKVRKPLWAWVEEFGEKLFEKDLQGLQDTELDKRIQLEFYYDILGNGGKAYVLRNQSGGDTAEILDQGDNPFYCNIDGNELPFLPVNFMYFMQVPSVRYSMSMCEQMVPHQIMLWQLEKNMSEAVERGRPHWVIEDETLDDKEYSNFVAGRTPGVLKIKKGTNGPIPMASMEISRSDMELYARNEQQLITQSGANPYAGGQRVEGVDFSAEVTQIASAASLTAGVVAKDALAHWERSCTMLLMAGATYDNQPIKLRIGETVLSFDEETPIKEFIRPDGDLVIRENSTSYLPMNERMNVALGTISVAAQAMAGPMGPKYAPMMDKAIEEYLRALGEKDIPAWIPPMNEAPMPTNVSAEDVSQAATQ